MKAKSKWSLLGILFISACSSSNSSGPGFPNIGSVTRSAVPVLASNSSSTALNRAYTAAVPDTSTISTLLSEWNTAIDPQQDLIGTIFGDFGAQGTVKSIFVVMDSAGNALNQVNSNLINSDGSLRNCTTLPDNTTITVPFFSAVDSTLTSIDSSRYKCYSKRSDNDFTFVGVHPIESPPENCTNAFTYHYLATSRVEGEPNTEQVESRGATVDRASVLQIEYNACSKDFKINAASHTRYELGVGFFPRTEIVGNAETSRFSIRVAYIDITDNTNTIFISSLGHGRSRKVGDTNGRFLIGYNRDFAGDNTSPVTFSGEGKNFCVKNEEAARTGIALDTENTCDSDASLVDAYLALSLILDTEGEMPRSLFAVTAAALGIPD